MTIYETMLAEYSGPNGAATPNDEQEVMQRIALAGLYQGGFFKHAAFYGGTCLRLFHGLPRFSEDMDFTLTEKRDDIHIENYFQAIIDEFHHDGMEVDIVKKDKKMFGRVESAFLKENTEAYDIKFQTKKTIKVKIELDTDPPLGFETEQKAMTRPMSFMTRCVALPDLYAGKMHALLYRAWARRIKGRDWFDFEWYVRNNVPLNFKHFHDRVLEFNEEDLSKELFKDRLREKIATSDINQVKEDVVRFIPDDSVLDIWSNDYFLQLADKIRFLP